MRDRSEIEATAHIRALLGARQLILDGELRRGDRVSELALVARLGVSRTPVRAALAQLREEGFVESLASGGYVVRSFSARDALDAIELRGTLEGLAARHAAERGTATATLRRMHDCLDEIDGVLAATDPNRDVSAYVRLNDDFHLLLWDAAQSPMIQEMIARLVRLPFASPNAFTLAKSQLPALRPLLVYSQQQHHGLLEAIENGEGARAEALAREHSRAAATYLADILQERYQSKTSDSPSLQLIRP